MGSIASQITSLTIVYSIVYSDADQRKHQSSASLAFVRGIHRGPVNSPHKWPVTRKMFPFDDVIMMSAAGLTSPYASTSTVMTKFWPRLNIKAVFPGMGFHYKDKTVASPSYLYNGNAYTGKSPSLYCSVSKLAIKRLTYHIAVFLFGLW